MKYTDDFFADLEASAQASAGAIVPWAVAIVKPRSVIDVGCGTGTWLAAFRDCGVNDLTGLDGSWVPQARLKVPPALFVACNLANPIRLPRRYDLVVSLEVAEHIGPDKAEEFILSLTKLGPLVLFSAAVPKQGGVGHVNEQWPAYWIDLYRRHGYRCVDCVRGQFWDDPAVAPWYAQNAFFFVSEESIAAYPELLLAEQSNSLAQNALVHPRQYFRMMEELNDPQSYSLRRAIRALPSLLWRALLVRLPSRNDRR